jgi:hypothetical protein
MVELSKYPDVNHSSGQFGHRHMWRHLSVCTPKRQVASGGYLAIRLMLVRSPFRTGCLLESTSHLLNRKSALSKLLTRFLHCRDEPMSGYLFLQLFGLDCFAVDCDVRLFPVSFTFLNSMSDEFPCIGLVVLLPTPLSKPVFILEFAVYLSFAYTIVACFQAWLSIHAPLPTHYE